MSYKDPQKQAEWRANHRQYAVEKTRKWREDNPEWERFNCKQWRTNHPERAKEIVKEWLAIHPGYMHEYQIKNRDQTRAYCRNRMALRKAALGTNTPSDIATIFASQNGCCYYCGKPLKSYHVDHKQPLSRGGSNWPENLACTCQFCNLSKHDSTEAEYLARMTL